MSSVFKNGYVESKFINQNYRGLSGWPCEFDGENCNGG